MKLSLKVKYLGQAVLQEKKWKKEEKEIHQVIFVGDGQKHFMDLV